MRAEYSSDQVTNLLQALIHENRVGSRDAIHPNFRVPVGGDHLGDVTGIAGVIADYLATPSALASAIPTTTAVLNADSALLNSVYRLSVAVFVSGVGFFVCAVSFAHLRKGASSLGGALLVTGGYLLRHASKDPMASDLVEAVENWEAAVWDWLQRESVALGPYFRMGPPLSDVNDLLARKKREFVTGFLERRIEQLAAITLELH